MKTKVLVFVLCLACISSYGQRKRKKKPAAKTQSTVQSALPVDTTKKVLAKVPSKPFDRPLDGYFKKNNILSRQGNALSKPA